MPSFLFAFGFFICGLLFMALALYFSKFKRRAGSCCYDVLGDIEGDGALCATCPNRELESAPENDNGKELSTRPASDPTALGTTNFTHVPHE